MRSTVGRARTWTFRSAREGFPSRRRPSFSPSHCHTSIFTPSPHTTSCDHVACRSVSVITRVDCAPDHPKMKILHPTTGSSPTKQSDHSPFMGSRPSTGDPALENTTLRLGGLHLGAASFLLPLIDVAVAFK